MGKAVRAYGCLLGIAALGGGCLDVALVGDQAAITATPSRADAGGSQVGDAAATPDSSSAMTDAGGAKCALDGRCEITDDCQDPDCVACVQPTTCPTRWPMCDEGYCVECVRDTDCGDWECDDGFCEPD